MTSIPVILWPSCCPRSTRWIRKKPPSIHSLVDRSPHLCAHHPSADQPAQPLEIGVRLGRLPVSPGVVVLVRHARLSLPRAPHRSGRANVSMARKRRHFRRSLAGELRKNIPYMGLSEWSKTGGPEGPRLLVYHCLRGPPHLRSSERQGCGNRE